MPWKVQNLMSSRMEFVSLASQEGANVSQLCRRFKVSRKTGNKWLSRYRSEGELGLADQSRRPSRSPERTSSATEEAVLKVRRDHPAWGGRKIREYLRQRGLAKRDASVVDLPAASTITSILHRHGMIEAAESLKRVPLRRFERASPNDLWQMDFKGHFALTLGGQCHPLTILDDHSRYALGLQACGDERGETVQRELKAVWRRYGMPRQMLMDNGSPWGCDAEYRDTWLTVWLMRMGILVSHGRPYHPQTQGKDERFHRTLKAEVLREPIRNMAEASRRFAAWREVYNRERPHEGLGMAVPASRYRVSAREYVEKLPRIEYGPEDEVRKVQSCGELNYVGIEYRISSAYAGEPVAVRANAKLADAGGLVLSADAWASESPDAEV